MQIQGNFGKSNSKGLEDTNNVDVNKGQRSRIKQQMKSNRTSKINENVVL